MNQQASQQVDSHYDELSLMDLLEARDVYHVHLMRHPNVVATAVGLYRIRKKDSWPNEPTKRKGTYSRTMENSEVRPYSWPCVMAFVGKWVDKSEFRAGAVDPEGMIPTTLYLPDGRKIPVCVIEAPIQQETSMTPPEVRYPINNLGGGFPVLINVQGQKHVATIACLVSDGHKSYALTNRHVTGEPGEVLYSRLDGKQIRIGVSSPRQLTRLPLSELYPGLAGSNVFVNLDIGLIDIDDLNSWTAEVREIGTIGRLVDLSSNTLSLRLIGRDVRGYGSTSKVMLGEIQAMFYRYQQQGGFEYVADFLIATRSQLSKRTGPKKDNEPKPLVTHPGDSGTLWLLEPEPGLPQTGAANGEQERPRPLAVQWGRQIINANNFVLATSLSTICARLEVDVIQGWNIGQTDTWGAVGHYSIASNVVRALSSKASNLQKLMTRNALVISPDNQTILNSDFKGQGSDAFVPLADVPDFFWKHGTQGFSRGNEGPNHFADMDHKRPNDGMDLLTLCKDKANISPDVWDQFYDSVNDILTGDPIQQKNRGLLPFRVSQIFDQMVRFANAKKTAEFVCAAGVLTHYVGDACQPLHISYLHDGDPEQPVARTISHRDGTSSTVTEPRGKGVHSAYEDEMVNAKRAQILAGLNATAKVKSSELIGSGSEAAKLTIDLMRNTFTKVPPSDIVLAFIQHGPKKAGRADALWAQFGTDTIKCMQDGTHLLAALWESAWTAGNGDANLDESLTLTQQKAMSICGDRSFLPSCTINQIGAVLQASAEMGRPRRGTTPVAAPVISRSM